MKSELFSPSGLHQVQFDPSILSKEDEHIFYGQRSWETNAFNNRFTIVSKKPSNRLIDFIEASQNSMKNQGRCCLQCLYIPHSNRFKSFFDIFMMFLVVYSVFTSLYYTTFAVSATGALVDFDLFVECCFAIEIVSNFFSGYKDVETHEIVVDVSVISKNYLKGTFILDLLAVFPYNYVSSGNNYLRLIRIIRLPRMLKLLNEQKIFNLIESIFERLTLDNKMKYMYASKYSYKIFRLMVIAIALLYFLGCLWYAVVVSCDDLDNDNISKYRCFAAIQPTGDDYKFSDYDNFNKLVISLYFILTTLATVGYGDYYPLSQTEKILDIFIMLIGIAFFSYIMSNFTTFLTNYDKVMGIENKTTDLQAWLDSMNLTSNTRISKEKLEEIYEEFEYYWKNNRLASITLKDEYLKIMPKELKKELITHLFYDVFFRDFRAFFLNRGREYSIDDFYIESAFALLPKKYQENEIVIKREQEINEIIFVSEGEIELSFELDGHKFCRYFKKGFYFGDYNILSQKPSEFNYIFKKQSKCFCFPKTKFIKILNTHPHLKDNILENSFQNYKSINLALVKNVQNELSVEKDEKFGMKEAWALFKDKILITPFTFRKREVIEFKQILHIFDEDENKIPKEKMRDELNNIKYALGELAEIDREWFHYF